MISLNIQTLKGTELADYRGKDIGYLFQNFELLEHLTGRENILLPLSLHGVPENASKKHLDQLTSFLEIRDVLNKFPPQMSGGQKQRIALTWRRQLELCPYSCLTLSIFNIQEPLSA